MARAYSYCVVPEKIHTHAMEGSLEIPRERGVLRTKLVEAMYEDKLEFPGGEGVQNKKPSAEYLLYAMKY